MAEAMRRLEVLVLNPISPSGLGRLPPERYAVVRDSPAPDVILVRSANMHGMRFPPNLVAVGRAGVGVDNIPVAELSRRGVPVFNAPGANANAVKELVVAGMLLAARRLVPALDFVRALDPADPELERRVEQGKKAFSGVELKGRALGIVGLGRVGRLVADAGGGLGMQVLGHDPEITVEAAWSLPAQVRRATSVEEVLRSADFVTLHVPLSERTRHLVNAGSLKHMREGAVLLNFAREGVVDDAAVAEALRAGRLAAYVTDFPAGASLGAPRAIALPHLGASTSEAEDNCAVMVVDQLRDYLEHGNVVNAVNFPDTVMGRESPYRLAVANANVPDMLARISHALGGRGLNIHNMLNKSRGETAYTLVDVDSPVPEEVVEELRAMSGVLAVRYLPLEA